MDGSQRPYVNLDAAASGSALPAVAERVQEYLPWYSSVHRGARHKSQVATAAYEDARPVDDARLFEAVEVIAATAPPAEYVRDPVTGDFWPERMGRADAALGHAASCRRA